MNLLKTRDGLTHEELIRIAEENRSRWIEVLCESEEEKKELMALEGDLLIDRFTTLLNFGTAGIRGKMKGGLAAMNRYTVSLVTASLAGLIKAIGREDDGVVIAYDSRNNSREFSACCASVLAKEGIKVYFFESLRPTPELSFSILELGCIAGINMTASHNPAPDNGYKCYWRDGAQLPPPEAAKVAEGCFDYDIEKVLDGCDFERSVSEGRIILVGEELDEKYMTEVLKQSVCKPTCPVDIVYTPLHGAGYRLVPEVLRRDGFTNVVSVEEQCVPNGDFPTVEKPNPQFIEAFALGIKKARTTGAELVIATDPDADRMGMAVKTESGEFEVLSGNQAGCLMIDFLINIKRANGTLAENSAVVKSLVSTELADVICRKNGIGIANTYTGFKYIGEKMNEWKKSGEHTFLLGFEESYGYLGGDYARDKDAVFASLIAAEMAAYYKSLGMNLFDALNALYEKYGYLAEFLVNVKVTDLDFKAAVTRRLDSLRACPPEKLASSKVIFINDYLKRERRNLLTGETEALPLASENMLSYETEAGAKLIIRPSGTEPIIKLYVFVRADNKSEAEKIKDVMISDMGF